MPEVHRLHGDRVLRIWTMKQGRRKERRRDHETERAMGENKTEKGGGKRGDKLVTV